MREKTDEPRIGVYVCHCGTNIGGVVHCEEVAKAAEDLPGVEVSRHYVYMCSEPGQALIREDIEKFKLNRVVVASCTPRMHEPTYQNVLADSGINPFFFEMANIREHVSWSHMGEPDDATEMAKDLVRMAVARARLLEPIEKMEVKVTERALVVGGGIAGLTAALDIARGGFEVYLVEREPYLGGHVALLNKLYWGEDADVLLTSLIKELPNYPQIKVLTNSEIDDLGGYIGNFNVKITQQPIYINERCNLCGKCEEVCPVSVPNKLNFGFDQHKAIHRSLPNSYPPKYIIERESCSECGECLKVCKSGAVNLEAEPFEINAEVGMIIVTTGFETYDPKGEFGYGESKYVITQLALERILSKNGPTKGEFVRPSDGKTPSSVVFVMCVGSRQEVMNEENDKKVNSWCSRFCCSSALKNALLIKEACPETEIYFLYRDIRTFGREHEKLYIMCRELGVNFLKYDIERLPQVIKGEDEQLLVRIKDWIFKVEMEILADLVVLVEGMIPRRDVEETRAKLSLTRSPDGFFQETHPKMNPLDTFTDGIFLGGAAQGPKDIIDTVYQASGAAAKATILLSQGRVLIDLVTATVDEDLCTGCGKCIDVCPYTAIELDEDKGIAVVTDVKCKGCGSCSATCPVGAVQLRHYRDDQILAMIDGLYPLLEEK